MIDAFRNLLGGLPDWLFEPLLALVAGLIGALIALAAHHILFRVLVRITRASSSKSDDILVAELARPTRFAFIAIGIVLAARRTPELADFWDAVSGFAMPLLAGWIALAILKAFVEAMVLRNDITVEDNRAARHRRTRLSIFSRILSSGIVFLTIALMLFSIPGVMKVGATLIASAGLAALAVGAAAQPALKAMIASFQMAMTQPIAVDDVVVIAGEWGRIEDIRATYVVVRVWDDRRLVVPTTKFLEETFENWTKTTSELIGTVMIYLDPATDIGPIREEYTRQIKAHRLFDGRAQILQVTDNNAASIEVRLLMSAKDGPTLFDLRCEIREGMIDWIRRNVPDALIRQRILPVAPIELVEMHQKSSLSQSDGEVADAAGV
jgi:small-conductance mechanosensitive channel